MLIKTCKGVLCGVALVALAFVPGRSGAISSAMAQGLSPSAVAAASQQSSAQSSTSDPASYQSAAGRGATISVEAVSPAPFQSDDIKSDMSLREGMRDEDQAMPPPASRRALAAPGEFEQYVSQLTGYPVRRFGYDLLVPGAGVFTAPPTTTIPPDYRINPGDELIVGLTGAVMADNVRLVVDQEGRVFIPRVGAVRVGGIAYRDVQGAIAEQVRKQYRDFRITVAIGALHGITVYLTGFAATPGSYTVSSLSTVINAVLAAGGPSEGGSFRSVQVRRNDRIVTDFDLYDFILKGDKSGDIVLQNGDVIFVAPAGAQVAAVGSVNREAIYEARPGDTLNDVLLYAGGANTVADLGRLHVLDPRSDNGWQEVAPGVISTRKVQRGEVLRVLSGVGIAQPSQRLQSLVTISGEVQRPGRYFVKPGATLDEVVAQAGGLTSQAYAFGAVFVRDGLRRQQQVNFDRALREIRTTLTAQPLVSAGGAQNDLAARIGAVDALVSQLKGRRIDGRLVLQASPQANGISGSFVVENNDSLYIPPRSLAVGVYGMVNSAADFRYTPGMRVRDYLNLAGGFSRFADKRHLFVVRANGTLLSGSGVRSAQALPGDLVFVPVDAGRGLFWQRLRDFFSFGTQGALAAASIIAVTK